MNEWSRRSLLKLFGLPPLAAMAPGAAFAADAGENGAGNAGFAPAPEGYARRRIQEQHLPNVPLVTQDGEHVRFYDDLIKDRIVTLNFFYADCDEICPRVTANLAKVQKLLGECVGQSVFMYSFTLKPETDSVEVLKHYRHMAGAGPGWTFLTGKPADIENLRKAIGFSYPDPAIDKDKTQHIGNVRYGNEPLMLWAACPGMAHASFIAESVSWMVHPETNRVQKS